MGDFEGERIVAIIGFALVAGACGGKSVVRLGSDGGNSGEVTEPPTGGSPENGGTSAGGTAGDVSGGSAGVATGGTSGVATGGTGALASGGASGAPLGHIDVEGDPYPKVEFENGMGYVDTCQWFPTGHGFNCWHFDGERSEYCENPATCNACLCGVPCDRRNGGDVSECPPGFSGTSIPSCVHETPNTNGTCMLVCNASTACPDGMTCAPYPELSISVCMWVAAGRG